jgi:DNA-binding LacI/PurR family transcriptional regulator
MFTESIHEVTGRRVDALVLLDLFMGFSASAGLSRLQVPVVLVDTTMAGLLRASLVRTDHRSGMRGAISYYRRLGHCRLMLISHEGQTLSARQRVRAFRECVDRSEWGYELPATANWRDRLMDVLALPLRPTVIFAGDRTLVDVLRAIDASKLNVPTDIRVTTWDDRGIAKLARAELDVIERDVYAMGASAAAQVVDWLNGGSTGNAIHRTAFFPQSLMPAANEAPVETLWRGLCEPVLDRPLAT